MTRLLQATTLYHNHFSASRASWEVELEVLNYIQQLLCIETFDLAVSTTPPPHYYRFYTII